MSSNYIQDIERSIAQAKARVEFGAALDRLRGNKDFKKVILEGYLQNEAVRLVHLKADDAMQTPAWQSQIEQQINAIGVLHRYFITVDQLRSQALKSIESDESMRDELLQEDLNG